MTPLAEAKRPSLNLVISLLATKTPDGTQFSRRNDPSSPIPFELPSSLPDSSLDQQHFRTRVHAVLDVLSRVVLTDCKQVAAVAASVAPPLPGSEKIHTTLYLSLNPGKGPTTDQMTVRIRDLISDLKNLTDPAVSNASQSPMITSISTEFLATFYNYGWKRFRYYYHKRIERLPEASRLLEQFKVEHANSTFFGPEHLEHLDLTLWWLANLGRVMQLSNEERRFKFAALAVAHQCKMFEGLIGRGDRPLTKLFMAYDIFEKYLKSKDNFIPIIRWVTKLCSLHVDVQRLVALATSLRFRCILFGDLDIKVYHQEAPRKQRIKCNNKVLLETIVYLRQKFEPSNGQGKDEQEKILTDEDIVENLKRELVKEWGKYFNPSTCIHCEVFLLRCIQTAGVSILPYIGVSKLSCVPCSVYFEQQDAAGFHPVSTTGSHGKVYPGWAFPSDGMDDERLSDLQNRVRDHLENYLWRYIDVMRSRRNSDSSVSSNDFICLVQEDWEGLSEEQGILEFFTSERWAAGSVISEL